MKNKVLKTGLFILSCLLFTACGSAEKSEIPTITEKPKVIIVDPATPTPTLIYEQGELPEGTVTSVPTETPKPVETVTPTSTPTATATPKPTEKPVATATPKPTKKPTATPVPTKAEQIPYEKGILTEEGFESKWMGLKFIAPEGMEMSSQQELDEIMRLMEEALYGELPEGKLDYANLALVYEMSAVWQDEGTLIQILVEPLTDASATVEDYVGQMQEETLVWEDENISYLVDDKLYSEEIGGKEFLNFGYKTFYGEEAALCQENYLRKQDDRIILISIMCEEETLGDIRKLLDAFTAY